MIDRRLLAGGLVVVLVVLGARHAMTSPDAPAAVNEVATAPAVRVDVPVPIGPPARAATSSTVGEPAVASSSVVTTSQPSTTLGLFVDDSGRAGRPGGRSPADAATG